MKRLTSGALVLAFVCLSAPAASAAACTYPEAPTMYYEGETLMFSFELDLAGCAWARLHRDITIQADWTWDGVLQSGGGRAELWCGSFSARRPSCHMEFDMQADDIALMDRYEGSVQFPWKQGRRATPFAFECSTIPTRSCTEV